MVISFFEKRSNMFGLGLPEIGIMAAIVIVLFGASRLPQLGKSLGSAISGFKKALADDKLAGSIEK